MNEVEEKVRIDDTSVGHGVFACKSIIAGQTVGEVLGTAGNNLGTDDCYHIHLSDTLSLDPQPPFRFLNHSCEPNCELLVAESDHPGQLPRVYLDTLRDIIPGEQLTIDYGWPASAAIECKCGAVTCRGYVVAESELPLVKKLSGVSTAHHE